MVDVQANISGSNGVDIEINYAGGGSIVGINQNETVSIGPSLRSNSLIGNGTSYVCANADGKLFRSQTPCV